MKRVLQLLGAIAVLASATPAQAQSSLAERLLRTINESIAGRLTVGSMAVSLPNGVRLRQTALVGADGVVIAQAQMVVARVDLVALAAGDVVLSELEVTAPTVNLTMQNGQLNALVALAPRNGVGNEAGRALNLSVQRATLTGGIVTFTGKDLKVGVSGLGMSGTVLLHGKTLLLEGIGGAARVKVVSHGVTVEGGEVGFAKARWAGRTVILEGGRFSLAGGPPGTVSGRIQLAEQTTLAFKGTTQVPANWWPEGLGQRPASYAPVRASFSVDGTLEEPTYAFDATTPRLWREHWELTGVRCQGTGNLSSVKATSLTARSMRGEVKGRGTFTFADLAVRADMELTGVSVASVLADPSLTGDLTGSAHLEGTLKEPIRMGVTSDLRGLHLGQRDRVEAPQAVRVVSTAHVLGDIITVSKARFTGAGADVVGSGTWNRVTGATDAHAQGHVKNLHAWVPAFKDNVVLDVTQLRVRARGAGKATRLDGAVKLDSGSYAGVPFHNVTSPWVLTGTALWLLNVEGTGAGGALKAQLKMNLGAGQEMTGRYQLRRALLHQLPLGKLSATGSVDASGVIAGTRQWPHITFRARSTNAVVEGQPLRDARLEGELERGVVQFARAEMGIAHGVVDAAGQWTPDSKLLNLKGTFDAVRLHQVTGLRSHEMHGLASGTFTLTGTTEAPAWTVDTAVEELAHQGVPLGGGHVLARRSGSGWMVDAQLPQAGVLGKVLWDTEHEQVDAAVTMRKMRLGVLAAVTPSMPPLGGMVDGLVFVTGSTRSPRVQAQIHATDVVYLPDNIPLGELTLVVNHAAEQLDAQLAAFDVVAVRARGSTREGEAVVVEGRLDAPQAQRWVSALARRGWVLQVHGDVSGTVPVRQPKLAALDVVLDTLVLEDPANANARLENEGLVVTHWKDQRLAIEQCDMVGLESRAAVTGWLSQSAAEVSVNGNLALGLLRAVTDEVGRTNGYMALDAQLAWRTGQRLRWSGTLKPGKDTRVFLRSLRQEIVLTGGLIRADAARIHVDGLDFETGHGGTGSIYGTVDMDEGEPTSADLHARAAALDVPTKYGPLEGGMELSLKGDFPKPVLSGVVTVVDGHIQETYEVQNFIATRPVALTTTPMWQRLPLLAGMAMNIKVNAESVHTRVDLGSYRMESAVRGDFTLGGTLREPQVSGIVESTDGVVRLGQSRFEIESAAVEFPLAADNRVHPVVHVQATTTLRPDVSPTGNAFPVVLTLDGPLERMVLDLRPGEDLVRISRAELLALVVTGQSTRQLLGLGGTQRGGDAALRVASSQALGFVERYLENQAQRVADLPIEVNLEAGATSGRATARWAATERLQLESSTDIDLGAASRNRDQDASAAAGPGLRGAARARLVVVDHTPLPGLQMVALEGALTDVGFSQLDAQSVDMRLRVRFFEF